MPYELWSMILFIIITIKNKYVIFLEMINCHDEMKGHLTACDVSSFLSDNIRLVPALTQIR